MDTKLLQAISKEIYQRFPELRGRKPRVQTVKPGQNASAGLAAPNGAAYLLVYSGRAVTSTGKQIPYVVRVVVSAQGKIIKISSSR
jgi:acetylornithine/succinyldiaminopimelate/putrescine aminotransferase